MTASKIIASMCSKIPGRSWANGFARFSFLVLFTFSFSTFSAPFIDDEVVDIESFDHLTTGFPLDGSHAILDCEGCHVGGVFDALPKECANCHDGVFAAGVSSTHIPVTDDCNVCHTSVNFLDASAGLMDHSVIAGTPCSGCHDGVTATGKGPDHLPTTAECDLCHNVNTWVVSGAPDHSSFPPGSCYTCHNGISASGKNPTHINSTDNCASCHESYPAGWAPVQSSAVDHNEVIGSCASCHDRVTAGGKPANHIDTTDACEACHAPGPTPWTLLLGVDHSQVIGACESCHNNIVAQGKPPNHIASSNDCFACHTVTAWSPTVLVDHTQLTGSCVSCHNNVVAVGKPASHITTTDQCDACHGIPPAGFAPLAPSDVDHSQVIGTCESCHNGTIARGKGPTHVTTLEPCDVCHTTNTWLVSFDHSTVAGQACSSCHDGIQATGKHASHINATDICEACHLNTTSWNPVASSNVDHSQVIGTCASCHDGVIASGKGPTHINTTDVCDACHLSGPTPWLPVVASAVDHGHVIGSCFSCHDGTTASGKGPTHISTTDFCEACHQSAPTPWTQVAPSAVDHNEVLGVCSSCHDGLIATGKGSTHIPTTQECNDCHSTQQWVPAAPDHTQVVPGQCFTCHDGVTASGKGPSHINSSNVCDACHVVFPGTWTPVVAASVDHTQVNGTCSSCHDGVIASGKSVNHINTSDVCDTCHAAGPTPWAPVIFVDHNEVNGVCSSCHDGIIASGKHATHIATTAECDACHSTTAWLPATGGSGGGVPDHSTFVGNCISCHDGVTASGKSPNHILSTDACDLCHQVFPATWTPLPAAAVDHSQVVGICSSCHNGTVASGKSPNHINTTNTCDACHAQGPSPWTPALTVEHGNVIGTCSSCHDGITATGKHATHIVTTADCDTCHSTTAWLPATGGSGGGAPDHSTFVGNCISCHDGVTASGKSPNHILSTDACDLCHQVFPATWTPLPAAAVDHSQVSGICSSCHNGTVASGKSPNHINSTNTCDACHAQGPTPWTPAQTVDHGHVIGTCASCHNGTTATGKPGNHPSTTDVCDVCHNIPPGTWLPFISPLDHSQVLGTCVSCHDNVVATGKPGNHPQTTDLCERCHSTPPAGTWLPYISPLDHSQVLGSCSSCHNNVTATGKPGNHPNTTNSCEFCHNVPPLTWLPFITPLDHTQVIGTCASCHNNTIATGKPGNHPNTSEVCENCHGTPPRAWANVAGLFSHADAFGLCTDCHGAGIAQGKPGGHCEPAGQCSDCHTTNNWAAFADCPTPLPPPPPPGAPPPVVLPPPPPVVP
ncbi:cytochrome c3 family protein, partial [Kaarinaea lacus]